MARIEILCSNLEVCLPLAYPSTIFKHFSSLKPLITQKEKNDTKINKVDDKKKKISKNHIHSSRMVNGLFKIDSFKDKGQLAAIIGHREHSSGQSGQARFGLKLEAQNFFR